jgi:YHS domain-containing protein
MKGAKKMKKLAASDQILIDPVCCMAIHPGNRHLMFTYKFRIYYFCAEACRKAFEADPEKYLNPSSPKRKGWWGRYLQRLEKATDGKSINCH